MTQEFIKAYCIGCDYCIYTDGKPWGCGEIDNDGCRSEELRLVKQCRLDHKPIPHTPRFNAGDRLEGIPNPIRILAVVTGINGHYITQMEGGYGKFNDTPYPEESIDLEEIDYNYEMADWLLQNQWISVDEALPDKGHDVLVAVLNTKTNTHFFGFDAIVDDSVFLRDKNGFTIDVNYHEITHWMPIQQLEGGE